MNDRTPRGIVQKLSRDLLQPVAIRLAARDLCCCLLGEEGPSAWATVTGSGNLLRVGVFQQRSNGMSKIGDCSVPVAVEGAAVVPPDVFKCALTATLPPPIAIGAEDGSVVAWALGEDARLAIPQSAAVLDPFSAPECGTRSTRSARNTRPLASVPRRPRTCPSHGSQKSWMGTRFFDPATQSPAAATPSAQPMTLEIVLRQGERESELLRGDMARRRTSIAVAGAVLIVAGAILARRRPSYSS